MSRKYNGNPNFCKVSIAKTVISYYFCNVFFIVLDLRLTKVWGSAEPLFLLLSVVCCALLSQGTMIGKLF